MQPADKLRKNIDAAEYKHALIRTKGQPSFFNGKVKVNIAGARTPFVCGGRSPHPFFFGQNVLGFARKTPRFRAGVKIIKRKAKRISGRMIALVNLPAGVRTMEPFY
ncbi:MAG: hypothetical protein ACNYPI_01825 [Arenicellales bacterium WSBS_2016_MAG_OTU3]